MGVTGGAEATLAGAGVASAGAAAEACADGALEAAAFACTANGSCSGASATSLRWSAPLVAFSRPSIDGGRLRPAPNAAANGELVRPTLGSAPTSAVAAEAVAPVAPVVPVAAAAGAAAGAGVVPSIAAGDGRRKSTGTATRSAASSAATG